MANILAVDDDEKIRELLSTLLKRKGHHVFTADHGQKGIDVFRRERPHVTILDFEMPVMDGLAVLREIRLIDPQAPVIMLTGAGTEERKQQARELGVTHFLAKGFSLHELGAALNLVLPSPDQDRIKRVRHA
ncbi:MAG TPA: response regulator [Nitrospiraceae bacterium]|jgi:DNA-binding response OmpR family regulator|nr:response regulator [Nitrospiraceae bacterium]